MTIDNARKKELAELAEFISIDYCPHSMVLPELIADALARCSTAVLTMGISAHDPGLLEIVARFRPSSYPMTVYTVAYGEPPGLDGRAVQPEIAVL